MSEKLISAVRSNCCGERVKPTLSLLENLDHRLKPAKSVWTFILLIPLTVFLLDQTKIYEVISIAASALVATLPFIAFAVLLIAYLKATGAETLVAKAFEGRTSRMIFLASLFGGLAPFCSCEVIPFVAGLLAVGVPLPAVMAFWLSSPLIDPPSLLITAASLGWHFAIAKALAAVSLGLLGGFLLHAFSHYPLIHSPLQTSSQTNGCCGTGPTQKAPQWAFWHEANRRREFLQQFAENSLFLIKWLLFAYLLEALLILYVPASLIGSIVGGEGAGPVVLGALVGMPAYLNSYAAPALVAGFMEQGMSAGSAMAFMIAGAISSVPAMVAVWSLVKKPVFFTYLGLGLSGAVLLGLVYNLVLFHWS